MCSHEPARGIYIHASQPGNIYIKSKMKTREGIANLVDSCGSRVSSDSQKAEILNNFFCSIFTKENVENVPECKKKQCHTSLSSVEFTKGSFLKKLQNLNPCKSPGPDGFHPLVHKELAEELAEPVALIFSKSLAEGKLTESWKDANITPLFKKGDKSRPGNYHPVSLTSVLGKVMESIIRDKVVEHMESNIQFLVRVSTQFHCKKVLHDKPLGSVRQVDRVA